MSDETEATTTHVIEFRVIDQADPPPEEERTAGGVVFVRREPPRLLESGEEIPAGPWLVLKRVVREQP